MISVAPGAFAGGSRPSSAAGSRLSARYDNATTTNENARNWWAVDALSAKAANSYQVRRILRTRSRYEVSNNPFLFGITHSNANDLIGGGPTLQVQTADAAYNREVETLWREWCEEVELAEKLRTCKLAKTVDGEGFLVLKTVEDLESPVKLYPCDVEADQVTTPAPNSLTDWWVDGLTLHPVTQRPTFFHVLKTHPGDFFFPTLNPLEVEKVPARFVIHWFLKSRPGQVRGVPVFTPSLDLFGELRAFRKAVLANAQIAASFTAMLESDLSPADVDDEDAEYTPFQRVPIERGMMTMLPAKTKLAGFDPKQPQTTYEMFQEKLLGEACRPISYPLNLALGTSQKFNFSSAKLDHINYRGELTSERTECVRVVLRRLFAAWFEEAVLSGVIGAVRGLRPPPHEWHWPGFESLDPMVDAQADQLRIAGGQDTLRDFWARRGKDWRDVLAQLSTERDEISRLGLTFGEPAKKTITEDGDGTDAKGTGGEKKEPAEARSRRRGFRAVKDDNGQEHADDGKFGEGGGGSKDDEDGEKESDKEHDDDDDGPTDRSSIGLSEKDSKAVDKWDKEDTKTEKTRDKEDEKSEKAREKEDKTTEKTREKEDKDHEKAEAALEKEKDKREDARDKVDEQREKAEAKEDADHEKKEAALEKEKEQRDEAREEEDGDIQDHRDKEDADHEKKEAALADREADRQEARDKEDEDEDPDEEKEKAREKEDADHEAEVAALNKEKADREAEREKEDTALQSERDAEDESHAEKEKKLQEERDEIDADREEAEAERNERREQQDADHEEKEAALQRAAEQREALREKEDAEREATRDREDHERQSQRDNEDADRYHERRKESSAAHGLWYDRQAHDKHGPKKKEEPKAARREAAHAA